MSPALAMIDPRVHHDDAIPPPARPAALFDPPAPAAAPVPEPGYPGTVPGPGEPPPLNQIPPAPAVPFAPAVSARGRLIDSGASQVDRNYAIIMHLSIFAASLAPYLSLVAPVVLWQIKKHESAFIDDHGREAVNFHLTILLYGTVFTLLSMAVIGIPFLVGTFVLGIIGAVLAAVSASRGEYFRYPMCLRFIK